MKTVIIDVRTPKEFRDGALAGAINIPSTKALIEDFMTYRNSHICLICESGSRANGVMKKLKSEGFQHVSVLEKNMEELRTKQRTAEGWSIDRQFRLALALLIGSFLLGYSMNMNVAFALPIIVFSGLVFSVITDNCYLKEMIAVLPWNQQAKQRL